MIEREKIDTQVKRVLEKNKLEKNFYPIIEEFLFRVADQCDYTEYELNIAINRLERVSKIQFINLEQTKFLIFKVKSSVAAFVRPDCRTNKMSVYFDIDDLKNILKFEKGSIEYIINVMMHELGHVIQSSKKQNTLNNKEKRNCGLSVDIIEAETQTYINSVDTIMNEFAEIINADRLQHGNLAREKYQGYDEIQNAGKIILSSLGITELEIANIQFKPYARADYEEFIANRLEGIESKIYVDSFGEIYDGMYKFLNNKKQRGNFILQIDALQSLSEKIFEERFENIRQNSKDTLKDFARLSMDQERKNNALSMLFDEFNIKSKELQRRDGIDIYAELSKQGYEDTYLKKLYEVETQERITLQKQIDKQNAKCYNNEELIERLYQSFKNYPLKNMSLNDRMEIMACKMMGKVKRKFFKKETTLLSNTTSSMHGKRTEFVSKISNREAYQGNEYLIQKKQGSIQVKKEGKENENIR